MDARSNRRSDRISISLPLQTTGIDAENRPFIDTATTIVVNRHGALIAFDRPLHIGQTLRVGRQLFDGSRREAEVRVVAHEKENSGSAYGIAFVDAKLDFWGIEFPTAAQAIDAVVRLLVECSHCNNQELAYLNSRELKEFESNRLFARNCRTCESPTIWKQPLESPRHNGAIDSHREEAGAESAATSPGRETTRYDTRLTACVRERVGGEEMAVCENVSRQGIAFRSRRKYAEGARLEVAVPYTPGTANVFIPAVVVHVRALPTAGLYRHGVRYVRKDLGEQVQKE